MTRPKTALYFSVSRPGISRSEFGTETGAKKKREGNKPSRFALTNLAELHVIQRATTPAREPTPITVDVVPRAVVPARVE